jgi:hypothetical protein
MTKPAPEARRTLTLHIGTGKAGSTSIQSHINALDPSRCGLRVIRTFGTPHAKFLAMSCRSPIAYSYFVERRGTMTEAEFNENAETIWERTRSEVEASRARRFVASSEFVGSMIRGDDVATLRDRLESLFDRIDVVVYLRDQRAFLRSLWAQSVKGPAKSGQSFDDFMETMDGRRYLWDYSIFLKQWLRVFGCEALKVTVFDPRALHDGDVVADFFHKAGLDAVPVSLEEERRNVSPSWPELEVLRLRNLARKGQSAKDGPSAEERSPDPARHELLVLEKVSKGNRWVNETFFDGGPARLPVR